MSLAPTVQVLEVDLDRERTRELVRERSVLTRLRVLLRREQPIEVEHDLYWPIALVHATASGTGRRRWTDRVQGAIDLVSGRTGLVDVELPAAREVAVDPSERIPARLSRQQALEAWHEYFRDHVDRRHKPLRPPALSVDRIERLWLPNHVASSGGRSFLVDPLTARVDELKNFPHVERMLAEPARRPELTSPPAAGRHSSVRPSNPI